MRLDECFPVKASISKMSKQYQDKTKWLFQLIFSQMTRHLLTFVHAHIGYSEKVLNKCYFVQHNIQTIILKANSPFITEICVDSKDTTPRGSQPKMAKLKPS